MWSRSSGFCMVELEQMVIDPSDTSIRQCWDFCRQVPCAVSFKGKRSSLLLRFLTKLIYLLIQSMFICTLITYPKTLVIDARFFLTHGDLLQGVLFGCPGLGLCTLSIGPVLCDFLQLSSGYTVPH